MRDVNYWIEQLTAYGIRTGLLPQDEEIYARNLLLDVLGLDSFVPSDEAREAEETLADILGALTDEAAERGLLEHNSVVYRDLFDTRLMNCLTPRPHEVRETFEALAREDIKKATDWFYKFSGDTNYIRRDRVVRDRKWKTKSPYGEIDITINLSKPEKDPKAIAAALKAKNSSYPACHLCIEAEGYAGRVNYPARQTHRLIPLTLTGEPWFLQYSPYTYYNEHCIVLSAEHRPMKVSKEGMSRLLEFTEKFPHYFLGSNADLPIVGGSILTHDHFQGGHYTFAMERAKISRSFELPQYPNIKAGVVHWPMSVLRLRAAKRELLAEAGAEILAKWREYSDPELGILAYSGDTPHNTITPIARRRGDDFELDLVLRNNRTTDESPWGIFHPREEYHHIKKENIGLIEVMGLAVLPARLKTELEAVAACLLDGSDPEAKEETKAHAAWIAELRERYQSFDAATVDQVLEDETGKVFVKVLEDAGVYKQDEAGQQGIERFIEHCKR